MEPDNQINTNTPIDGQAEPQLTPSSSVVGSEPNQATLDQKNKNRLILRKTGAVMLVIAGLVGSFWLGFIVSFGACYKQSCSPLESAAPLWIPMASLLITVPTAVRIFKDGKS